MHSLCLLHTGMHFPVIKLANVDSDACPRNTLVSCPCHTCLLLFDPACVMTMCMNKSLHLDPLYSRLVGSVTEYSATQGSSGFSKGPWPGMGPFDQLLVLRQGSLSIEGYVTQFCELFYFMCAAHSAEPPKAAVLTSAPCVMVAPSNAISACNVMVEGTVAELTLYHDGTTVETPEMAVPAADPLEVSVVSTYEFSSCPVTAMEGVCDSSSCCVMAMEGVCES